MAKEAEQIVVEAEQISNGFLKNVSEELMLMHLQDVVSGKMIAARIETVAEKQLEISLNSAANLSKDMPVYLAPGSTVTDAEYTKTVWFNMSLPYIPMGFIQTVFNSTRASINVTNKHCYVALNKTTLPALQVPKDKDVIPKAKALLKALTELGIDSGKQLRDAKEPVKETLQLGIRDSMRFAVPRMFLNVSEADDKVTLKD